MYKYKIIDSNTRFIVTSDVDAFYEATFNGDEETAKETVSSLNVKIIELEALKKLKENSQQAQKKIEEFYRDSPSFEQETFPIQQTEYYAYLLDENVPTPFVDGILLDSETKVELMTRIGLAISYIQGIQKEMRQHSKDIKACDSLDCLGSL